jgi:hypothetical protein
MRRIAFWSLGFAVSSDLKIVSLELDAQIFPEDAGNFHANLQCLAGVVHVGPGTRLSDTPYCCR